MSVLSQSPVSTGPERRPCRAPAFAACESRNWKHQSCRQSALIQCSAGVLAGGRAGQRQDGSAPLPPVSPAARPRPAQPPAPAALTAHQTLWPQNRVPLPTRHSGRSVPGGCVQLLHVLAAPEFTLRRLTGLFSHLGPSGWGWRADGVISARPPRTRAPGQPKRRWLAGARWWLAEPFRLPCGALAFRRQLVLWMAVVQ